MQRMGKGVTVECWSNSDGEFGVAVVELARARDNESPILSEIEMTPEQLVELATDCLVMARMKSGGSIVIPHSEKPVV